MIKFRYTVLAALLWLPFVVWIMGSGTMWQLIEPKLIDKEVHALEYQLFELSTNSNSNSDRLIIGNKDFLNKVEPNSSAQIDHQIELSRGNLCVFGMAIAEYSKKWSADEYWVQVSPQYLSNIHLGSIEAGPRPQLEYWKAYSEKINAKNILQMVKLFFKGAETYLTPSDTPNRKNNENVPMISLRDLSYEFRSPQLKCLTREMKLIGIKESQLVLVRHVDGVDTSSNIELVEKFESCFNSSECSDQIKFDSNISIRGNDNER